MANLNYSGKYDDIINTVYPFPKRHPAMSMEERAAQFAPFAALTGFGAAIDETGRYTGSFVELDDDEKNLLDRKLREAIFLGGQNNQTTVSVTYYVPDNYKDGGSYETHRGVIKKVDEYSRKIIFADGAQVELDMVNDIMLTPQVKDEKDKNENLY